MTHPAPPTHGSPVRLLLAVLRLPHAARLALSVFLLGFALSLAVPFMALFAVQEAGLSPLQLGIFLSLNAIGAVLMATRLARWSDRWPSRKPLVLLTLAAGAAAYALLAVVRSYPALLVVGAVFLGTGTAAFPQVFSLARAALQEVPGDLAERAMTALRSVFSLSWVVGPGLGALALAHLDFAGVFALASGCFALAALSLLWVPGRPPRATVGPDQPATAEPRRAVLWAALAFVLYGMAMSMGMTFFPLFVTGTLGQSEGLVGVLVGLCALLEIPVMLALVAWRGPPPVARLVTAGMGLFTLHFALLLLAQGTAALVAAQVLRAVVLALLAGLGMTYFQTLMPGRFAAATTLFANTGSLGGMLSGITAGAWAQTFGYRSVFLLCAALTGAAWLLMLWRGQAQGGAMKGGAVKGPDTAETAGAAHPVSAPRG
ncbi:sugar efflux transporter [Deinococcus arcticus]|uniref:sugar efflux transporter n=1 Tax=Deinococcus arcticus TaxID=2136176 RepID=UPI001E3754AA|nr:sugar efflux transporter [Deinococcus arcticus]